MTLLLTSMNYSEWLLPSIRAFKKLLQAINYSAKSFIWFSMYISTMIFSRNLITCLLQAVHFHRIRWPLLCIEYILRQNVIIRKNNIQHKLIRCLCVLYTQITYIRFYYYDLKRVTYVADKRYLCNNDWLGYEETFNNSTLHRWNNNR
jgi:hypothetical protein